MKWTLTVLLLVTSLLVILEKKFEGVALLARTIEKLHTPKKKVQKKLPSHCFSNKRYAQLIRQTSATLYASAVDTSGTAIQIYMRKSFFNLFVLDPRKQRVCRLVIGKVVRAEIGFFHGLFGEHFRWHLVLKKDAGGWKLIVLRKRYGMFHWSILFSGENKFFFYGQKERFLDYHFQKL